jgi:hypothetical protein
VIVDGVAYFTSDDHSRREGVSKTADFPCVVAFDAHTFKKIRTYDFDFTYDSTPLVFEKKDGTWLVIAHEYKNKRTVAMNRDTGEEVWWVKRPDAGGVTPCVDQDNGFIFYQCTGKVLKIRAADGAVLKEVAVPKPNRCISWNTVLVDDAHGYYIATRWYGAPEWDSALRVYDKDLNLLWEKTGLPIGKKDTITYAEGKLIPGSGNGWSKAYKGDDWKYIAAYAIGDGAMVWQCDLSGIDYIDILNLPYANGYLYGENGGSPSTTAKCFRINAANGNLEELFDYGRTITSCATHIIAHGNMYSGDLWNDGIVVTKLYDNGKAEWPGPFGDPQTNQMAAASESGIETVQIEEVRSAGP